MSEPAVSIILPTYNGLPYLREAIESVRTQTFANWELIVIDDGSTDDSVRWLESLGDARARPIAGPIYVNALGDAEGNGPGGIFVLDPETFEIKGRWERDRGPQYLAYDFWWHPGARHDDCGAVRRWSKDVPGGQSLPSGVMG